MPRRLTLVGGAGISAILLAAVVLWALRQQPPQLPSTRDAVVGIGLALALYAGSTALRAERWYQLLAAGHSHARRADTGALTLVGYFGNNTLPARAGDAMRVMLLPLNAGGTRREVAGTLVAERLLDVIVLALVFVVVAVSLIDDVRVPDVPSIVPIGAGVALACVGAVAWVMHRRGALKDIVAWLRPVAASPLRLGGRHGIEMVLLTVAIWTVEAGVWWAAGIAAGLRMTPIEAVYLLSAASLFSMIPSGPGYAGTQDAAIIIGAKAIGAGGSVAFTYLLVLRFVLLVPATVAGLVVLLTRYGGLQMLRRTISTPRRAAP